VRFQWCQTRPSQQGRDKQEPDQDRRTAFDEFKCSSMCAVEEEEEKEEEDEEE
jgi:hypothetical protein